MFQIDPPPTFNTDFIKYTIFFFWSRPLAIYLHMQIYNKQTWLDIGTDIFWQLRFNQA